MFAIDAMGTRVVAAELTEGPPVVFITEWTASVRSSPRLALYELRRLEAAEHLAGRFDF